MYKRKKADCVMSLFFIRKSYGRGCGVGRGRGVGVHLPVHGAGVAVGVGVGVVEGVAVGPGATQYFPPVLAVALLWSITPPQTIISLPVQIAE